MKKAISNPKGFTLIELMIVVAIIGILSAVATPAYLNHVRRTRQAEGVQKLLDVKTAQEKYFALNDRYAGPGILIPGSTWTGYSSIRDYVSFSIATTNDRKYYLFEITAAGTNSFTARARGDLNNDGTRTDCWDIMHNTTEPALNTASAPCAADSEGLSLSLLTHLW